MGNEFYNQEGYADPVPYQALRSIGNNEGRNCSRTLVYICSPYAGDTAGNTEKAKRYSRFAVAQNMVPITPHLFFPLFMDDSNPEERRTAMHMNMVLLGKCSELWVFGDVVSEGMQQEIARAKTRQMVIRYFTEGMKEREA